MLSQTKATLSRRPTKESEKVMEFVFLAVFMTLLFVVPCTAIVLIRERSKKRVLLSAVGLSVLVSFINWMTLIWGRPVVSFSLTAYFHTWWLWMVDLLLVIGGLCAAAFDRWDEDDKNEKGKTISHWRLPKGAWVLIVVWGMLFFGGIFTMMGGVWTSDRAHQLVSQVKDSEQEPGVYPESDTNHMVVVPLEVARTKAGIAMSSGSTNLATYYEINEPALQVVGGKAYWIVPFQPKSLLNNNKVNGVVNGYVVVDAEDQRVDASIRTKNAEGKEFKLNYSLDGYFGTNLQRYAWKNGFRGVPVEDWILEVDDQWNPYWTASFNKRTLNFRHTVPAGLVTIDPQTGKIITYKLIEVPAWVDRIYSANAAKAMVSWWGRWGTAPYGWIMPKGDRYIVSEDQAPTLVVTKDGHPKWQMELSSPNNDKSAVFVVLFDGRSNTMLRYRISTLPVEGQVSNAILTSASNLKKNKPTHISLHKIYGQLTWVAPLIDPEEGDEDPDRSNFQGLALLRSNSTNGSDVVIGQQVNDALNAYRISLGNSTTTKPGEDSTLRVTSGTVATVSNPVTEGKFSVFYFVLLQDKAHVYKVAIDPTAQSPNLEIPFIKANTKVKIDFQDTAEKLRIVQNYDDLSLSIGG